MRLDDWNEIESVEGELAMYRSRVVGILRKYLRMAAEAGRLPSLIGREFFATTVTSYHTHTFEDTVIFVLDMELVLDRLDEEARQLIAYVIFQEYTHDEVCSLSGIRRSYFGRRLALALDRLTRLLLDRGLMDTISHLPASSEIVNRDTREKRLYRWVNGPVGRPKRGSPKLCQETKNVKIAVTA